MVIRSGLLGTLGVVLALSLSAPAFAEGPDRDARPDYRPAEYGFHNQKADYPKDEDMVKVAGAVLELGYLIYKDSKHKDHDDEHYQKVDYGHGHKQGHYKKGHYKKGRYKQGHYKQGHGHDDYAYRHGKHHGKRDYGNYRDSDHYGWRYDQHGYKRHVKVHRYHGGGYDCHPVKKKGYFHGRPAKIGGTMCYDRYGKGYIAKGSRYLIKYVRY